jgi:hypothetical protein
VAGDTGAALRVCSPASRRFGAQLEDAIAQGHSLLIADALAPAQPAAHAASSASTSASATMAVASDGANGAGGDGGGDGAGDDPCDSQSHGGSSDDHRFSNSGTLALGAGGVLAAADARLTHALHPAVVSALERRPVRLAGRSAMRVWLGDKEAE